MSKPIWTLLLAGLLLAACAEDDPAGTYAVDLAQPAHRLIRTLLDPEVPMEEDFLAEQERRRAKDLGHEIYTYYLLEALERSGDGKVDLNDDGALSAFEAHGYASFRKVPLLPPDFSISSMSVMRIPRS